MAYDDIILPVAHTGISSSQFGIPVKNAIDDLDERVAAVELSAWTGIHKPSDTTRTSTTTLTADPHLVVPVLGTGVYHGRATLYWNANNGTNGGAEIRLTFPSSDIIWTQLRPASVSGTNNGANVSVDYGGEAVTAGVNTSGIALRVGTGFLITQVDFALFVGTFSGNLTLEWAQDTSSAVGTVLKKGSAITLFRQG